MGEKLEPKIINELSQFSFYVPAYQRGYRWTSQEVADLLNDIRDFKPRQILPTDDKTWYCLQPIVIKHKENNVYEVIDGQQRLTTIYLILHYLNQDYKEDSPLRDKLFEINYQTRTTTASFLKSLGTEQEEDAGKYIDFYYIKQAYETIKNWFREKDRSFDIFDFRSKFNFNTKVIWYESAEEEPIAVFTRLNIGKISLTNAELIKALFLNSSNFGHGATKEERITLKKKQLEISTEWDNIENDLQNDRFWYFISDSQKMNNRIEFIFDIISKKPISGDSFFTFRHFNDKFINRTTDVIDDNWKEVRNYYQRLHEWYNERSLYHKIGYLICTKKITIRDLLNASSEMTKSEFEIYLHKLIKESLVGVKIGDLTYSDKNRLKNVLLLYNILTMLQNGNDDSKFPFDIYKKDEWDIEHITAIKEEMPKEKEMEQWLKDALPYIDVLKDGADSLIARIHSFNEADGGFESLFNDVIVHFEENIEDEDINHISNLALLDSKTNRGYKNAVFPVKRKTIIERDKSGTFIPICTKNVFLKYFTEYPPKISFWTWEDREKYRQDLENILLNYTEE
ncbi:MAG: DUF262 domain-containing protein [Defluviitaleaceae bacterium]|nr:DUF262 domain-containing protein [Defluviitaleaceae bacterium]